MNTFSKEIAVRAFNLAGGDCGKFISILDNQSRPPMEWVNNLSLLCAFSGEDESSYVIPDNGTAKQKADAYWNRLMLAERVFNEGWVSNIADIKQEKWSVWANIIPDASRPFGFRLAFDDCVYDLSASDLGARPEFKNKAIARYVFETFTSDYEGFLYYTNLSKQNK